MLRDRKAAIARLARVAPAARAGAALLALCLGTAAFLGLGLSLRIAAAPRGAVPPSAALRWEEGLNLRQSYNSCASYATMAFAFALRGERLDPEAVNASIGGRMANRYTYPWGITSYLGARGIAARSYWLGPLRPEARLGWLRVRLARGEPVVIVVGDRRYLHYVTVLGYSGSRFELYDSMLESDRNGAGPGNLSLGGRELLARWASARFRGLELDLAVAASD